MHGFFVSHLLSKCAAQKKEERLFSHFTGFNSHNEFMNTLQFLLPNLDRTGLLYWDSHARKDVTIDTETLFQHDSCESDTETAVDEDESECSLSTTTRTAAHKVSVENGFLLVLMRLKMGLSVIDLAERFCINEAILSSALTTYISR